MSNLKVDFKCPECNKKNRIKISILVNDTVIPSIIDKSFFKYNCKNCNKETILLHPLTVEWNDVSISFLEKNKSSKSVIKRITKDYDDFKEKLMIFNENLNDILLEFIKDYIKNNLDINDRNKASIIRFNELREDALIFYIFGVEKYVSIDINFYNNLLDKSKIKDDSNYKEINDITYHKYFKL